jgi:2-polyprenyl-6-hydroxyphenyl methylase/3-demethylubiquinone-9 3-methyltransferase
MQSLSSLSEQPGGHLFISTISRTVLSYLLTIVAAEHVLRLVTPGTHTHSKYVKPEELLDFFCKPMRQDHIPTIVQTEGEVSKPWISRLYNGAPTRREAEVRGIVYLPWAGRWELAPRGWNGLTECNYMLWVRKPNGP